jgi:hypothetical protein
MQCVEIDVQTRRLHGITCNGNGKTGKNPGIVVNASNNSIENVFMQAFWDGIEIGNITSAVGNVVISNVEGATGTLGGVMNTVHICGLHSGKFGACSTTQTAVTDVTILGATNKSGGTSLSVQDDVTGTSIAGSGSLTTGMYILGESVAGVGYSRFASPSPSSSSTGSTVVPTWGVGSAMALI